jgi:hypothetical protein
VFTIAALDGSLRHQLDHIIEQQPAPPPTDLFEGLKTQ